MCERLVGERGLPAPGRWMSPAATTPPGGFFGRVRTGYKWDTNHGGTAQRLDRLSAATAEAVSEYQTWPRRRALSYLSQG